MRLGKVIFTTDYVVDLDNEAMVNHAIDVILQDVSSLVYNGELVDCIMLDEEEGLTSNEIQEFLLDDEGQI